MRLKLFEEYINDSSNRIKTLFDNMIEMFKTFFNSGIENNNNNEDDIENDEKILSDEELNALTFIEIEQSNTNDNFEKNIIMQFSDEEYYYQIVFIVKVEDVKTEIDKAYIIIKVYDYDGKLINKTQTNLDIKVSSDDDILNEGRFYVKVKPVKTGEEPQSTQEPQPTENDENYDYIENFIISKIGDIKGILKK